MQQAIEGDADVDPSDASAFKALEPGDKGHYIRGLRLWLQTKFHLDQVADELGYLNVLPGTVRVCDTSTFSNRHS